MNRTAYIILISGFVFSYSLAWGQYRLTIDLTKKFQTIEGFGASDAWRCQFVGKNWPEEKRNRIADLLFSREYDQEGNPVGIGLSVWRFYIGSGSAGQRDSSGIRNEWRRSECFLDAEGRYDWNKQAGQQWFLKAAKRRGVERFLGFSIAAPVFWSLNGKGYSIKGDNRFNLQPEKYDDYASFLVNVLGHFKQQGIVFDYLSPFNEPQWDWSKQTQEGTAATNGELYLFMKYLARELDNSNLSTQIVPGEAGSLKFLYSENGKEAQGDQIDVFFSGNSPLYIGNLPHMAPIISGHSYFTSWPVRQLTDVREKLAAKLKENDGLKFWQTEFCILQKSDELGGGRPRDLGMTTALYVARVMHADLTIANASSWQWWTALTQYDYKDGLIYLDTGKKDDMFDKEALKYDGEVRDSKLLWVFGNFSRFVRPGMVRVKAAFSTSVSSGEQAKNVMASAFYNAENKETSLVLINETEENQRIEITNTNIVWSKSYITSGKNDLEFKAISNDRIKLPARSVTTLVGQVKGKAPEWTNERD